MCFLEVYLKMDSKKYDVVIIGSGIGGLAAGCYLSKHKYKCLIIEQGNKVGGYCTSYTKDGFVFDSGPHSLGNCSKGPLQSLIVDFELEKLINFNKPEITDIVHIKNNIYKLFSENNKSLLSLQNSFPKEHQALDNFFKFILGVSSLQLIQQSRNLKFNEFLKRFFSDKQLIEFFSVFCFSKGMSAEKISAIAGIYILKDYIFAGGFYPMGGMQKFSDALLYRYKQMNGEIVLNNRVKKILLNKKNCAGVLLESGMSIDARFIISNCDARQTYLKLIGSQHLEHSFVKKISAMKFSNSALILYVGLKGKLPSSVNVCSTMWIPIDQKDMKKYPQLKKFGRLTRYYLVTFPSRHDPSMAPAQKDSVTVIVNVPFLKKKFWEIERSWLAQYFLSHLEHVIPNITKIREFVNIATPLNLTHYTLNSNGAAFGWASSNQQIFENKIEQKTMFENLFLCGHWTVLLDGYGGIPHAVFSGKRVAEMILHKAH